MVVDDTEVDVVVDDTEVDVVVDDTEVDVVVDDTEVDVVVDDSGLDEVVVVKAAEVVVSPAVVAVAGGASDEDVLLGATAVDNVPAGVPPQLAATTKTAASMSVAATSPRECLVAALIERLLLYRPVYVAPSTIGLQSRPGKGSQHAGSRHV